MKYIKSMLKRRLIFNSLWFSFAVIMLSDVYAFGTDYIHSQYSQEEKSKVIGYLELKKITSHEVANESIQSFDISQDGTLMAVAFSNHKIGVYDINGKWLWGLTDIDHQGGFDCEIDDIDNELLAISQRGDTIYKIDRDLNVLDAVKFEHENNGDIYPNLELKRPKVRGEKVYKMSRTKVWMEESGVKTVLIDHSMEVSVQAIVFIIIIGIFVAVSFLVEKEKRDQAKNVN